MSIKNRIIPCLSYDDAKAAIQFLCDAFGFEKLHYYENEDSKVAHCQLNFMGNGIMVGDAASGSPFSKYIIQPKEVGGKETQTPYVVIDGDKIDAHYENAKKRGARIAMELEEQPYGGKNYAAFDLEGHLWSFGSYDPSAEG